MKKIAYLFMSLAMVAMVSCSKEGEQGPAGPSGPAGPAGPAGDDADFSVHPLTITVADWDGNEYTELEADFITEDLYNNGIAVCYVQDSFQYWNTVPSQWHPITGFGFSYIDMGDGTFIGIVGFDAANGVPTSDVNVRIVTMKRTQYEELSEEGLIADYNAVVSYLGAKK